VVGFQLLLTNMIVSWNWLKQYVKLDISVDELAHRLTMVGLNHESTSDVAGDIAIDFEVTSNRPDCLGHIGIAREAALVLGRDLSVPDVRYRTSLPSACELTGVEVTCPDLCPRYTARVIRGVKIGPSPPWLSGRLATCGIKSINNVVDVTNYVMLEASQPLHAFDLDKLHEHRIVVRRARSGESIVAINQKRYECQSDMCVIADCDRAIALAGVMGGFDTEVSDNTVNLLIESAEFDPVSVRRTARALGLHSPSSYRFERGVDPSGVDSASRRCCQLITEVASGTVAEGLVAVAAPVMPRPPIVLRFAQIKRILGIDIDACAARRTLVGLGLAELQHDASMVQVRPPSWRRDLEREIDLIEEVGRVHGYDHVPEDVEVPMTSAPRGNVERVESAIRQTLGAAGFFEAVTMSFVDERLASSFRVWSSGEPLAVDHPSRRHENLLRPSLIPSLLVARRVNESRGTLDGDLFEIARAYVAPGVSPGQTQQSPPQARLPDERTHVGLVSGRDLRELRGVIEILLAHLHSRAPLEIRPADHSEFAPALSGELWIDDERVGYVGQICERLVTQFDLRAACSIAELRLDPLVAVAQLIPQFKPVSSLPASLRELSLILDEAVTWSAVESLVRAVAGPYLESIQFLDLYRGRPIPSGRKSLHFALTYRAADRTLTHDEVDQSQAAIVTACRENFHAELRGA
jgi:phenylalanyl-tRNA synthetase beta chain